jgi:hypothetical protein
MAVGDGRVESARGLATRYMSTIHRVPNGVGVGLDNLISHTTRQARFPMQNVIPLIGLAASLVC